MDATTTSDDPHMDKIIEEITHVSSIVAELRAMGVSDEVDAMLNNLLLRTNKLSVLAVSYPTTQKRSEPEPMAQASPSAFTNFTAGSSNISGQPVASTPRFGGGFGSSTNSNY